MADKKNEETATEAKASKSKYEKGERVIELTQDITGGLGRRKKGEVLRNLSLSAFVGLKAGGHKVLHGDDEQTPVTGAPPAPVG